MKLAERLAKAAGPNPSPRTLCALTRCLGALNDEDRAVAVEAVRSDLPASVLARELEAATGIAVTAKNIHDTRAGRCLACVKTGVVA